jgi:hypothetical protein
MEKEDRLFQAFLELRERFPVEDLVLVFTRTKALAFESLRIKFFGAVEVI